jgi:hypothetical protein
MTIARAATTGMSSAEFVREVEGIFQRYWGGHYEVVKSFFGQARPREQLIAWLELQLYKEIHVIPVKAREIIELYERLDDDLERGEFVAECYELADEAEHYRLLADILELLTGKRRRARDFKATPEQLELEAVRRTYAGGGTLTRSIGGFAPGGGTAFAAAGSLIEGGPVERQLAEAFKIIYKQELEHYNKNRYVFDRLVEKADPGEHDEGLRYAHALARQHFLLRNASFGHPLAPERVADIEAGNVTPYVPPVLY